MGKYFGTDGFRGEANVVLTVEHAFKVGRYLGWYYGQEHKARIVIGKDTRRSSYMFEYALAAGLTASGADAYLLHVTTTPSVSYVVRTEDFDCGIMISASHNPYYDNGIKVINSKGQKLEAEVEAKVEAYIDGESGEIPLAKKEAIGRTVDYAAGRNRYIGHLISLATRSFKDVKVGLDCSNGSSSSIAKSIYILVTYEHSISVLLRRSSLSAVSLAIPRAAAKIACCTLVVPLGSLSSIVSSAVKSLLLFKNSNLSREILYFSLIHCTI